MAVYGYGYNHYYYDIDPNWASDISSTWHNSTEMSSRTVTTYSLWFLVPFWTMMISMSVVTVVGNAMVVVAYHIDRSIRKQISNRFIISLALSDMIIGLEGLPFFTAFVTKGEVWTMGEAACQTWLFLDYTLCLVSILTVLLITIDRYMSVCHTAKYMQWQTKTRVHYLIFISWMLPMLFFAIMIFAWEAMTQEKVDDETKCYAPFLSNQWVNMGMYFSYYWSTLIAMLILYTGIHKASRKLQAKGEAREKRTIALLMGQRLGAQTALTAIRLAREEPLHYALPIMQRLLLQVGLKLLLQSDNKVDDDAHTNTPDIEHLMTHADQNAPVHEKRLVQHKPLNKVLHRLDDNITQAPLLPAVEVHDGAESGYHTGSVPAIDQTNGVNVYHMEQMSLFQDDGDTTPAEVLLQRQATVRSALESSLASQQSLEFYCADECSLGSAFQDANLASVLDFGLTLASTDPLSTPQPVTIANGHLPHSPYVHCAKRYSWRAVGAKTASTHPRIAHHSSFQSRGGRVVVTLTEHSTPVQMTENDMRQNHSEDDEPTSRCDEPLLESETPSVPKTERRIYIEAEQPSVHNCESGREERVEQDEEENDDGSSSSEEGSQVPPAEHNTSTPRRYAKHLAPPSAGNAKKHSTTSRASIAKRKSTMTRLLNRLRHDSDASEGKATTTSDSDDERETHHDHEAVEMNALPHVSLMQSLLKPINILRKRRKTKAERRAHKAFRTITFIVGFFAVLWSPYFIVATIYGFCEQCVPSWLFITCYYLCYFNSTGNPFMYALANRQFKNAFMRMLHGDFRKL